MPLLADLWQAGLMRMPGDACRVAVAAACAALVSGGRKEGLPPGSAPGSLLGAKPASAGGGGGQGVGRESMEQRLQRWCCSCEVFAEAAASELLTKEGSSAVEAQLYEELKRTLAGAAPEHMRRAGPLVKEGSILLCRGVGTSAVRAERQPGPPGHFSAREAAPPAASAAELAASKKAEEAAADAVAAIAHEALRNSELISSEPAVAARTGLDEVGLIEPRCLPGLLSRPGSRPQSRTRLMPIDTGAAAAGSPAKPVGGEASPGAPTSERGFGTSVSPTEHMAAAARRAGSLKALEGGMLRLEAARFDMRRGRVPPPSRLQAVGLPPPRSDERRF